MTPRTHSTIAKTALAASTFAIVLASTPRPAAAGPIAFSGSSAYTQDFQTMGTTAATSGVAASAMTEVSTLSGGTGIDGWYIYGSGWSGTGNKWFAADSGASNSGGFREMYSSADDNKALGSLASSSALGFFGVVLLNSSGNTINNVTLSYIPVINRNPSTTPNPYPLSYRVSSATVISGSSTGDGTFNTSAGTWTSSALGFTTPSAGTGAPGTQAAINPMFQMTPVNGNLTGLNWQANQYLYVRWEDTNDSGNDATAGVDNFSLSLLSSRSLVWNLAGGGTWNTTSANWLVSGTGSATTFSDGLDTVTFGNAAGGTIALTGPLSPIAMNVTAPSGTYTFTGATAADKITGAASLSKSGGGTAVFTSANDFSGGSNITGGTVRFSDDGQLGSGAITVNGGSLASAAVSGISLSNAVSIGSGGGTIATGGQSLTVAGAATVGGILTKTGPGDLILAGPITSNAGAGYNVQAGNVLLGSGPTASGVLKLFANTSLTGNLVLSGTQRLDFSDGVVVSGAGQLQLPTSGALLSTGGIGGTIAVPIAANSTSQPFTPGSWSGAFYTPGTFLTTLGGFVGGTMALNAGIRGDTDVDFSTSSNSGGGNGTLQLNAVSTYTGNTTINAGTPAAGSASVRLGVANAIPTTSGLVVGTKTAIGAAVLDLNGFSQKVAYLADSTYAAVGSTKNLTISNSGTSDATLTIEGSVTPGIGFGGVIGTGPTNKIHVVKAGGNTQTLTGSSTYTGNTTIQAGTLALFGEASIAATPLITVDAGASLDVNGLTTGFTLASGQTLAGSGAVIGAATLGPNSTVSPAGSSVGTITMGSTTLDAGGLYSLQLYDAAGVAGSGWDLIQTDTLTLPSLGSFAVGLSSVASGTGGSGAALNFSNATAGSWKIIAANTISGAFSPSSFTVDSAGFTNDLGGGRFAISDIGTDGTGLYLVFTPGQSLIWKGGSGTWTQSGGTDWSGGGWDPTSTAVFNASSGTVTIAPAGVTAESGLRFNATGYVVTGGELALTGATANVNVITAGSGVTATISAPMAATNGFSKEGPGRLVIAGDANAAGGVVVSSGTMQVGAGGTTGSLAGDVSLGTASALVFNRSDAVSHAGRINGVGSVTTAAGDLTLAGDVGGAVDITNTGSSTITLAGGVGGSTTVTNSGPGIIRFTGGTVDTSGGIEATGGRIEFGDAGLGSGSVALANGATVAFDGTASKTLSNAITVAASGGRVEVAASDQLTLAGSIVRTGTLTKTGAGTLASGTLPTSNVVVASGTYLYTGTSTTNVGANLGGMFGGGVLALSASNARLNLNVNQTGSGAIVFTQPGQSLAQNGSLTNLNVTVSNPIRLELPSGSVNIGTTGTSNTLILDAPISGTGDVRFAAGSSSTSGLGVTVLNAASTFTGNVVVDSGTSGVHRLGVANAIPVTAGVNFDGTSGVIDLAGYSQRITYLTGGTSSAPGGFVNSSSSAATLTVNGTANTEFSGRIGSTGSAAIALVKAGVGSLTLAGTNTYTGATSIDGGVLSVNGVNGPSVITVNSLGTLAGTGTAAAATVNSGGTLSPGASPGTLTLTGNLTLNSGGNYNWQMLSATGTAGDVGSWDLASAGGTLSIASTSADPFKINLWTLSGTGPDVNGDAVNFDASQSYTWKIATASGGITGFAANKFAISTSATNGTGGFSNGMAGGTFSLAQSGNDLNLVFTASGATPTVITINVASGTQTQSQAGYPLLAGSTPVVKTGGGALVVDQANTLTGSTSVQQGILRLANASSLGSSTLAVSAGGTAQVASFLMTTVGGLDLAGGGLVDVTSGFVTVAGGLSATDLVAQILAGRGDGSWTGTSGITSSTAAADIALGASRAVGWLDNGNGSLSFAFAAPGDTNLDWQVDVLDAANLLTAGRFNAGAPATWSQGDFNYDGVVDVLDAADFIATGLYNAGPYNPAAGIAASVAAVPEPSLPAAGLVAAGLAFTARRRRRR